MNSSVGPVGDQRRVRVEVHIRIHRVGIVGIRWRVESRWCSMGMGLGRL